MTTECKAQPIPTQPQRRARSNSTVDASTLATSPTLSASQRFAALSLSPPTSLQSDSFRQAVEHARSLSISAGSGPASRASSETTSEPDDPLITPPSTSPRMNRAASLGGGVNSNNNTKAVIFENEGDTEEEEDLDDALWSRGARWGFPQQSAHGNGMPQHVRRGSTGAPPSSMAPLTRVASAGAPSKPAPEGLGLFRRFSIGTSRPKPPSPPPMAPETIPLPNAQTGGVSASQQPPSTKDDTAGKSRTGRGLFAGSGTKPKRKLSPMGERMLRGGAFD